MSFKRTKIIATIGPSSSEPAVLTALIGAGMNVARFNFSHGTHEDHAKNIKSVRAAAKKAERPIGLLQDLSGPKVRIGDFSTESITLVPGATFILSTLPCVGTPERVFINYPYLHAEVKKGARILLDDGRRTLEVTGVQGNDIHTTVIVGGTIKGRRGVNIPGAFRKIGAITKKDRADLAFGLTQGVDFVALSFVRSADDIRTLRKLINKHAPKNSPDIIAKIETVEAIENIDAIIAETDGVMVARGDLAVEVSPENVPFLQKTIIRKSIAAGKPVITATQMLESMIQNPVPTRAEIGDVANAILDGTDAVMLSQETAMGDYPVEAVTMMATVARKTENHSTYHDPFKTVHHSERQVVDALGHAVVETAHTIHAKAIVALSESGFTAHMVSRCRPSLPTIVFTPHELTARKLTLAFACHPYITKPFTDLLTVVSESKKAILRQKLAVTGDAIVIIAGIPFKKVGGANTLLIQTLP